MSEAVKKWRKETKNKIVEIMGDCCQMCGKTFPAYVYDLHHIEAGGKEATIASMLANPTKLETICEELQKCALLCATCHRIYHHSDNEYLFISPYNNEVANYYIAEKIPCVGKDFGCTVLLLKNNGKIACSKECSGKYNQAQQMAKKNKISYKKAVSNQNTCVLQLLFENDYNFSEVGRLLGISDNGVRSRQRRALKELETIL